MEFIDANRGSSITRCDITFWYLNKLSFFLREAQNNKDDDDKTTQYKYLGMEDIASSNFGVFGRRGK